MNMKRTRKILAILASIAFVLALAGPILAAQLESPDDVKTALRLLVQGSNDFKPQITKTNFALVPHDYLEYADPADPSRTATKHEPDAFRHRAGPSLEP